MSDKQNKTKSIWTKLTDWAMPTNGSGNLLQGSATPINGILNPVPDQAAVRVLEPRGTVAPELKLDRTTGYSQISNLSHEFTMEKVQGAFRSAENGDTRLLFTYYRDFFLGSGIVASELSKRKISTLSEQWNIVPHDKKNKDDVIAAEAIKEILLNTPNLTQTISHMLNAIIYPVSVCEKIFETINDENWLGDNKYNLKYKLKGIYPVDYNMISYKLAYFPVMQAPISTYNGQILTPLPNLNTGINNQDVVYDVDSWEPDLRFWPILPIGTIMQVPPMMIAPDPYRHLVYRENLLNGIARDNFGGLGKSLLFLTIMSQLGQDIFLRCLQKYGLPFVTIKADESQIDTVNKILETFGNMSSVLNAIAVNKDADVILNEMSYASAADAHEKFLNFINDLIRGLISGQTLSSSAKSTGLGSGVANLHGEVRNDYIQFDRLSLTEAFRTQLFPYLLKWNGLKGHCPTITWGGQASSDDNKVISETILNLFNAGLEPTEESMEILSEKLGFTVQRIELPPEPKPDNNKIVPPDKDIEDKSEPDVIVD